MKYATEMGSGAMICTPRFIKIGSGIQKWIGGDTVILDTITIVLRKFNKNMLLISAQ
jgi:hypothetical protein